MNSAQHPSPSLVPASPVAAPPGTESARFHLFAETFERIAAADTRTEILELIGSCARRLAGAHGASILLSEGGSFRYAHVELPAGPPCGAQCRPLDACVAGWAVGGGTTAVVGDVLADPRVTTAAVSPEDRPHGFRSMMMAPLGADSPFGAIGVYWAEVRQPLPDEVGALEALARAAGAVLERLQSSNGLQASVERLSAIFEHAAVGLSEISLDGRLRRVNDCFCRMLKRSRSDLIGASMIDSVHPDDAETSIEGVQRAVATGETVTIDHRFLHADGGTIRATTTITRIDDRQGKPDRLLAVSIDVTERHRAEAALRESEERYRILAEMSPDATLVSLNRRLVYANQATVRLLAARDADDIIGRGALYFVEPEYRDAAGQRIDAVVKSRRANQLMEKRWRRLDGKVIDVEVSSGPITWNGSRAAQILLRDVSVRKQTELALRESEERYRTLFESIDEGFCVIDVGLGDEGKPHTYRYVEANPAFERQMGVHGIVGKTAGQLPGELDQSWIGLCGRVAATGEPERSVRPAHPSSDRWLNIYAFPCAAPERHRIAVLFTDITAEKRVQDELQVSNERLKLAIEGSGDGAWDWDITNHTYVCSQRLQDIFECDADQPFSCAEDWEACVHPEDVAGVRKTLQACLKGETAAYAAEYRVRTKDGRWKWILSRGHVVSRDAQQRATRMSGMITDISERKQADDRIWRHANFDTLTGLPNRRLFRDRLEHEVRKAHRTSGKIGLLFIDLDRFKQVNDMLGHDAGDLLLTEAARRIQSCVRETDTVARLGGDEFTVILTEIGKLLQVERVCRKILGALDAPFHLGNEVAYVSGSIGVTLYPDDADTPEELIRKADQAMYAAKNAGKNQFSYFTRSMDEKARLRLRLSHELRSALHAGQLQVHYQPVIDLSAGRIVKAEALLRWNHPFLGAVAPSEFIPLAEESGLINEIGNWVFREAAAWSKRWSDRLGAPFQISVNKSPIQFLSDGQDMDWLRHLDELGLRANCISVEITEGLLLHASPSVTGKLLEYRDAGVQVAIDDFGTGYSSMAYLKKFDIDYLKIDQSFVSDIVNDAGNRAIAESIIVMAHKLGLKVIAEGIETGDQRRLLIEAGCDYGQGFLFSPAVPADEFELLLHGAPAAVAIGLH